MIYNFSSVNYSMCTYMKPWYIQIVYIPMMLESEKCAVILPFAFD